MGAFCYPFVVQMDCDVKLMGLGLEFGVAIGADERGRHQYEICDYEDQSNRNRNVIPRNLNGVAKPIYSTGCQG